MIFWPNLTFDLFIFFTKLAIKAWVIFYRGAVNIENVAVYVGNKFYLNGFSIQPVYQVKKKKGFRQEKRAEKVSFWDLK